ncbi:MAG TPA: ABC transporter ATP-binding protein [Chloroflexota bacterium]|nr:ABC transporter ATP-binding protein [Chloroflexota bacterium]
MTALSFEGVTKRFGRGRRATPALENVTWSIATGARACLLGPNGAGKSTSIRLLQGALQPTHGAVALLGAPIGSAGYWDARRRTGIVPQGPGMYRDVTTREYLQLARRLYDRGDVGRELARFGLEEHAGKMLLQLSGGLQRRVSLAAALLPEPDVLLLDEPTVGLDPVAANEVQAALREVMAGRTTLLCTHNLAEAEALCDEVVILRSGTVLVHDTLAHLRQRVTPALQLRARQGADALLRALTATHHGGHDAHVQGEWVRVTSDDPESLAPDVLRRLLGAGIDVLECRVARASLEDLFLEAVRA